MQRTPHEFELPCFTVDARRSGEDYWVLVSGELDISTTDDLRIALSAVELGADGTVWLRMAELDFADAGSLDQLVGFTRLAREAGREVGVFGAQGVVLKMIRLMGLESELAVA